MEKVVGDLVGDLYESARVIRRQRRVSTRVGCELAKTCVRLRRVACGSKPVELLETAVRAPERHSLGCAGVGWRKERSRSG